MRRRSSGFCCHCASVKRRSPRPGSTDERPAAIDKNSRSRATLVPVIMSADAELVSVCAITPPRHVTAPWLERTQASFVDEHQRTYGVVSVRDRADDGNRTRIISLEG